MILLEPEAIATDINPYFLQDKIISNGFSQPEGPLKFSELLGLWPAGNRWETFTSHTDDNFIHFVPVYWIDFPMVSDEIISNDPVEWKILQKSLYFRGCDDVSYAIEMPSKEEALKWIYECPYPDFDILMDKFYNKDLDRYDLPKMYWFN